MKEEIKKIKSIKRREFFSRMGKGFAGILLLNALPMKSFWKKDKVTNESNKKIKVLVHPLAVKRNNKGFH
jgi:hypothetical protein